MYKTTELLFELITDKMVCDDFGVDVILSVGTRNNDDNINSFTVDDKMFTLYFEDIQDNIFVLTDEGKENLKSNADIINFCTSLGMIHE